MKPVLKPKIDKSLYRCQNWPKAKRLRSQKDVARYIVKGKAAHADCKGRLRSAGRIHEKFNLRARSTEQRLRDVR